MRDEDMDADQRDVLSERLQSGMAYVTLFLAGDESRFISGILMPVDGAASARVG